jgi:Leu/Phe-tRNA-protein transferase
MALHHLVTHLQEQGFLLFDIQMVTPITEQLGAVAIPRSRYLKRLGKALEKRCRFQKLKS